MGIIKKALHSKIDVFVKFEGAINLEIRGQIKKKTGFLLFGLHGPYGFKTGIHLKKHRFINIARSHCSIFINRKKIKTLKINYIAFYITLL